MLQVLLLIAFILLTTGIITIIWLLCKEEEGSSKSGNHIRKL